MTNIKMYESLVKYVTSLTDEEQKAINGLVERNETVKAETPSLFDLSNMIIELKGDIMTDEAKRTGKGNLLKLMQAIIKQANKHINASIHNAHIKDGYQYVCDSFTAVRTTNILDLPKNTTGAKTLNFEQIFNKSINCNDIPLELPKVEDLKVYIKLQKAEDKANNIKSLKISYEFGENLPVVDAEKLLLILENAKNIEAYADKGVFNPIYFKSEDAEIILCPINPKK